MPNNCYLGYNVKSWPAPPACPINREGALYAGVAWWGGSSLAT